ncbi:MAG: hypothetical protein AAGD25_30145 [Cyanobacteria bacterium P01_F01_bin.150]
MAKQPPPGMNGNRYLPPDKFRNHIRLAAKGESLAVPGLVMVGLVILAWAIAAHIPNFSNLKTLFGLPSTPMKQMSEPFRVAVNKAMLAAILTQDAQYQEEWKKVEFLWTEAIDLMAQVSEDSTQYEIAQAKVDEYGDNLKYASTMARTRPSGAPIKNQLWSEGATREFLLAVQGSPSEVVLQDSLCKETYRYDNSEVELIHGLVSQYDNRDNNLNASPVADIVSDEARVNFRKTGYWALGSRVEDVLSIQGTPTRVKSYEALSTDIFYYQHNLVELHNDIVVGYSNFDGILKIDIDAMIPGIGHDAIASTTANTWNIGSSRAEVFKIQGTPSQVERSDSDCIETLHYEDSTIDLKNGQVQEYDNFSNNLKVRLRNP